MPSWTKLPCQYSSLTQLCSGPTWGLRSGDIGFYVNISASGAFLFVHTVIVGRVNTTLIHSNKSLGVYTSNFNPHKTAIFFSFQG